MMLSSEEYKKIALECKEHCFGFDRLAAKLFKKICMIEEWKKDNSSNPWKSNSI